MIGSPISENVQTNEFPIFGIKKFTSEEESLLRIHLEKMATSKDICFREGPTNRMNKSFVPDYIKLFNHYICNGAVEIPYIKKEITVDLANKIFGVNGWSCQIIKYEEISGKYTCGSYAIIRVTLKDGCFREDVGYGYTCADTLAQAIMNSKKIAVSDALKRCIKLFGTAFGNGLNRKFQRLLDNNNNKN